MKGSFAKRLVITVYFLLIKQEVNPLVLKRAGKQVLSDLDGEVRLKLVNGQGKRFIENEKGEVIGHDVANYQQQAQEKRGGKFFWI